MKESPADWRQGRAGGFAPLRASPIAGSSNPVFQAACRSNVDAQCQDIGVVKLRSEFHSRVQQMADELCSRQWATPVLPQQLAD